MSRNYVLNTGNGVSLFVGSNQNVGFHTATPSERLHFDKGHAKFNSNVYVMRKMGISTSNPSVELDVTGDAHVTGDISVEGDMQIYNPIMVNGFYVTKNSARSNNILKTAISSAVHNMDVNEAGTKFALGNTGQEFRFIATSNENNILKIGGNGDVTVYGNILPDSNLAYDLGSSNKRFRDLYLSGNTINMDGVTISKDASTGNIKLQDATTGSMKSLMVSELQLVDNNKIFKIKHDSNVGKVKFVSLDNSSNELEDPPIPNLFTHNSNIGIGLSNPSARLHVSDDAIINTSKIGSYVGDKSFAMFAHSNSASTTGYALLHHSGGDTYVNAASGKTIRFRINNNDAVSINAAGRLGIGISNPSVSLEVNATDSLKVPVGTTAQRPAAPQQGYIRYNTSINTFEGYGSVWGSLGGVRDTNQDTYISVESFPTSNDDTIRFFNSNNETLRVTSGGRVGISNQAPSERLELSGGNAKFNSNVYVVSRLGVGTSNPDSVFHVNGSTIVNGNFQILTSGIDTVSRTYPPTTLSSSTQTLSGQSYGNGTYIITGSVNTTDGWKAFDGTNNTYWITGDYGGASSTYNGSADNNTVMSGTTYTGHWFQLVLPSPIIPTAYLLGAVDRSFSPDTWYFGGSLDGVTWTLLDSKVTQGTTILSNFTTSTISISTTSQYRYFRILATKLINQTQFAIGEFGVRGYGVINGVNQMTVSDSTGNIGFGTSNPQAKVDIVGNMKSSSNIYASVSIGVGTSNQTESLQVLNKIYTLSQYLCNSNDTVSVPSYSWKEDSNTGIFHASNDSIGFSTNGAERLRITDTGNIGIGNTNPSFTLDVSGTINASCTAGGNAILGTNSNLTNGQFIHSVLGFTATSSNCGVMKYTHYGSGSSNIIQFGIWGQNNLTCTANGNVGVGTMTPSVRLDVVGTTNSSAGYTSGTAILQSNDSQNGNWKITGNAQGSYDGIRFTTADITVMAGNAGTKRAGFHYNGVGWGIYVDENRNLYCPGDITGYWSDKRLKSNLQQIQDHDYILSSLTGYRFNWNEKGQEILQKSKEDVEIGLIAQDVQSVVDHEQDEVFDYLTIKYDKLIPILIEGYKHQKSRIETLEGEMVQLKRLIMSLV